MEDIVQSKTIEETKTQSVLLSRQNSRQIVTPSMDDYDDNESKKDKKQKKSKKDNDKEGKKKRKDKGASIEIKLKRLDIARAAKGTYIRMQTDKNVKELINQI